MIAAHRLSKRFGRFLAVNSVDFEIPQGEVVGFLGPNGAGKTTTIRMICGYLCPTAGTVRVDGQDVQGNRRQVQRRIGYLPEAAPLYTEMRVVEYLKFRARLFGIKRAHRRPAIDLAMKRCLLSDVVRQPITQLSRGYRQRVSLAAALLHQPPVLILDEPTAGLDPSQIRELRGLIRELAGRHTILISTHNLAEVESTCDRVLILAGGRIRAAGTIDELRAAAAGKTRYVVETDATGADEALSRLPGVADVQYSRLSDGWGRLTVTAADGSADLRESIARELGRRAGATRELRREAPTLEHLFVHLVAEADAAPSESAAERSGT